MERPRRRASPRRLADRGPRAQAGAVAMVVLLIALAAISYAMVTALSAQTLQADREIRTAEALARAKEALIAYAATYGHFYPGEAHGYLPCPDTGTTEGSPAPPCGLKDVSAIGKLPWRGLGLPALFDGSGECLWYAVAGRYKNNPKTDALNWDTPGQFEVVASDGATFLAGPYTAAPATEAQQAANDSLAVAVIFAPGGATGAQSRSAASGNMVCPGNYSAANYLDQDGAISNAAVSATAGAITRFIMGPNQNVNDRLVFITKDEIFSAMQASLRRMTEAAAQCVAWYATQNAGYGSGDRRLPWATPLALGNYALNCSYNDGDDWMAGRLSNAVGSSSTEITNPTFPFGTCVESGSTNQLLRQATPCPGWSSAYPLWSQWKSFLFYAVGDEFEPDGSSTPACGDCVQVGSSRYAGIVLFAGKRLAGQYRNTAGQMASASNYLEGANAANIALETSADGDETYVTGPVSASFNDVLYCIAADLSVAPCP